MKKLLKFVLVLAMCATMMSMTVFAAGSGSMAVESKTAQAGQTVSVDVSITGNPGVAALVIVPEYDSSVLTLDSITGSGLQWTTGKAASWSDAANTTYTGKILTLNFTVNENATHGTTSVSVKVDASNYDEELVSFSVSSGTVTIECSHAEKTVNAKEATCSAEGYTGDVICSVCGEELQKGSVIPKTAHTEKTVNAKEATCSAEGYTGDVICSVCGEELQKGSVIEKTAHTEKTVNAKEATCSAEGYTGDVICSVCGEELQKGSVIEKTEHSYEWVIDKEATTDATGLKHEECTECGAKRSEGTVIPKKEVPAGHTHVYGGLDMDETYHWTYCSCGKIGAKGVHNFEVKKTEGNVNFVRCKDCGYETTQAVGAGNVSTGDSSNLMLWVMAMAVAGIATVTVVSKKKNR